MALEVQELPDVIKVITLLNLQDGLEAERSLLRKKIEKFVGCGCISQADYDKAVEEMVSEGLVRSTDGKIALTAQGVRLSMEWKSLFFKREPILETVAGLTDGSITGLIVIISSYVAGLPASSSTYAALLSLSAVAMTNFSSFLMGGKTEDVADLLSIRNLIEFGLSDIKDKVERDKSFLIIASLFSALRREINRSNLLAAAVSGITTFLAGIIPIAIFLLLPKPLDIILSLAFVGVVVIAFLVRYRAKKTKIPWKMTLLETLGIIVIATVISLILSEL